MVKLPPPGFQQPIPDPDPREKRREGFEKRRKELEKEGVPMCECTGLHFIYYGRCEQCGGFE